MTFQELPARRFLTIEQVAEELSVGIPQIKALVKSGELRGFQVGGRGYLARLLRWMRIVTGFTGQERRIEREISARFVRIVEPRCAVVGA